MSQVLNSMQAVDSNTEHFPPTIATGLAVGPEPRAHRTRGQGQGWARGRGQAGLQGCPHTRAHYLSPEQTRGTC